MKKNTTTTQAENYLASNPNLATGDTVKGAICVDYYNSGVRTWTFEDGSALVFEAGDIEIMTGENE